MEGANANLNGQYNCEASSDRWVRTDGLRVIRQGKGVTCPPQWLPVLLASHQSAPPTRRRRRLVDSVFTTRASLKTAVQAYNDDAASAIATYGPVADWDVSAITNMFRLFYNLQNFNADISSWVTSSVTNMRQMFRVRSAGPLPPAFIMSRAPPCAQLGTSHIHLPPPGPHLARIVCPAPNL